MLRDFLGVKLYSPDMRLLQFGHFETELFPEPIIWLLWNLRIILRRASSIVNEVFSQ